MAGAVQSEKQTSLNNHQCLNSILKSKQEIFPVL